MAPDDPPRDPKLRWFDHRAFRLGAWVAMAWVLGAASLRAVAGDAWNAGVSVAFLAGAAAIARWVAPAPAVIAFALHAAAAINVTG